MTQWFDFCPSCGSRTIPCKCSAAMPCRWCLRSHHPKVECEARKAGIEKILMVESERMQANISTDKAGAKGMNAPTDAQLNDPAWWDEHAEPWADAVWLVWSGQPYESALLRLQWTRSIDGTDGLIVSHGQRADRYVRPSEPAWRPGDPCRVLMPWPVAHWCSGRIIGRDGEQYVVKVERYYFAVGPDEIRSRSVEREREELVRQAARVLEMKSGSPITLYIKYCEDLYDAGLLRKGGE